MSCPGDPPPEVWGGLAVVRRIDQARPRTRVVVAGIVTSVRTACWRSMQTCVIEIDDGTGRLTLHFTGRRRLPGVAPGTVCRVEGTAIADGAGLALWNPAYVLIRAVKEGGDPSGPGPRG